MPDARKREAVVAVQFRRLACPALNQRRSFVRCSGLGRIHTVGHLVGLHFVKGEGRHQSRHGGIRGLVFQPFRESVAGGRAQRDGLPFPGGNPLGQLRQSLVGGGVRQDESRRRRAIDKPAEWILPRLVDILEKGEKGIEIPHGYRVEFVIVTAGTLQCQAQKRRAERIDAIDHITDAKFFLDDAALFVLQVEAVEGGGEPLFPGGVRQQVAGELPGHKPVEGQVFIEGLDDPVAIRPDWPGRIHLIAVGIGVARQIEPLGSHALAEPRRIQEPIHHFPVGIR